ncbi:unnamed protein product, partial [Laminaria digitata]
ALVDASDRTWVDVDANAYDTRTSGSGCNPNGCVPDNTRDGSRSDNSRWSCQGDIPYSSDEGEGCCITYSFEEPQDIVRMRIAFHKGDENTRTLYVVDNGSYHSTITSSGSTLGFQNFNIDTDETEEIMLCLGDPLWYTDTWLSITEVR